MENYEVQGQIGKGSFGLVQKIKRKSDGKILVWKEMNYGKMSEREKQQLVAEVNIIRELRHQNIVRYYDRIIEKKESKIFIIMEHCEGGDMGSLLKKCKKEKDYIAEDVIWKIFTQIVLALNECHNRPQGKILHRDLKPANIFLDAQNNIKLGDFGLSRVMGENSEFARTHVGTPYYMSPEQIQESKYNEKSDIWSAGCLLYEMAALKPPFEATNHLSLAIKIKSGKFERLPLRYSEELQKLVESMLNTDPDIRPSVQQLIDLQQINLRLKERKFREKYSETKVKEDDLKKREEQLQEKLEKVDKKEKEIIQQEQMLKELEEQVKQLQKQLTVRLSQNQFKIDENIQKSNEGLLPQKSSRSEHQLLSQNLNSFGKDLLLFKANIENNSSGSASKNSTIASSNNTFEMFKKDKENMINNMNLQNSNTCIENQMKEKEIQRQLQTLNMNNKNTLFQKSNSSINSQSLLEQQQQSQQQLPLEMFSPSNFQLVSNPSSQNGRIIYDAKLPPQNSCSSNSSNEKNSLCQASNTKELNQQSNIRRDLDSLQKTPSNHQNYNSQINIHHQQSTEVDSVTKKITPFVKDYQQKSVDHFTSIKNNNSSSKKDESTAFSTTCKLQPQSASQNQSTAHQSNDKNSHISSSENFPKKFTITNSVAQKLLMNLNSDEKLNQNISENNQITKITSFDQYKATVLNNQSTNNTYSNKYNQIKQKARVVSTDNYDENNSKIANCQSSKQNTSSNQIQVKARAQKSFDSACFRNNVETKNYLNQKNNLSQYGTNVQQNIQSSTIARRFANNTIDSVKYSQMINNNNNHNNTFNQTANIVNNANIHELYKQANIRRTDSYKENPFKNITQQFNDTKQESSNIQAGNNQKQATSYTQIAQKNALKQNKSSLEPKSRLYSHHSTSISQQQQGQTQVSTQNTNKNLSNYNNPRNMQQTSQNIDDVDISSNFKTLPNTENSYDNIRNSTKINNMQIKKKNNNSFSGIPSSYSYISQNNQCQVNQQNNGNMIGNNTDRNTIEQSIERKKDFPIRPRNNYPLPQKIQSVNQQQNNGVNKNNYFSENNQTLQTEYTLNKQNSRKIDEYNVVSPTGQYNLNQQRINTQY